MSNNSNLNHQSNSVWNSHFTWFNNKLTSWWTQKQPQGFDNTKKSANLHRYDSINKQFSNLKSKQHNLSTNHMSNILSKMRNKNMDCIEEKIKRTSKYFSKKDMIKQKNGDFICPICLQLLVKPVLTVCGHHFCIKCLDETLLFKADCPSCRHSLKGTKIIQCDSLSKIIQRQVAKYSSQEIQFYNESLIQSLNWLKQKTIVPLQISINTKLDVKDTEHIWCIGIVKEIFYEKKNSKALLIHYQGWNPIYDQVIEISSDRLAREGFYTTRIDIPHYKVSHHEQRMYSYVITGEDNLQNNGLFPFFPPQQINSEDDQQAPHQEERDEGSQSQHSIVIEQNEPPLAIELLNQMVEQQDKIQEIQNNINNLQIQIEQYSVNIQSLLSSFQQTLNENIEKKQDLKHTDQKQGKGQVQAELNWESQQNPEKWKYLLQY